MINRVRTSVLLAFKKKNLFYTNLCLSLGLSGVGDIIEQRYEIYTGYIKKWDKLRTTKMASTGIPIGIFCHYYYVFLDKYLPGRTLKVVVKKVLIDQCICSPLCISAFLICMDYMDGATLDEFIVDFKQKGLRLYKADWMFMPPAQIINFCFLPTKYRVLYDNIISLGFDVYTSFVNYNNPGTGSTS